MPKRTQARTRAKTSPTHPRAPLARHHDVRDQVRVAAPRWLLFAMPLLAIAIGIVYSRVFGTGYLPWDDDYNLYKNPWIALGNWQHLWTEPFYGMYVPVTSTLWAALYSLAGGAPWPYRIVNAIFHVTNAFLVFVLARETLRKLKTPSDAAAMVAAAVFALHPLQVGSVAWISDLRGIMSAFFALLATLTFFRWRGWIGTLAAVALFALGLLSKPQIASLPLALGIAVFVLERAAFQISLLRLLPWLGCSFAAAMITHFAQKAVVEWQTPFWMRPIVMADSYGFYALKTVFPWPLMVDYGRTPGYLEADPTRSIHTILVFLLLVAATVYLMRKDRKWTLAGLWFVFHLPTSGIVDFGYQQISTVTDHYNYVPLIVVSLTVSMAIAPLIESLRSRRLAIAGASALAVALTVTSFIRAGAWSEERAFFTDMVEKNPNSYSALIGMTNMSCMSNDRSEIVRGHEYAKRATMVRENDPVAVADLAVCLIRLERYPEVLALESYLDREDFVRRLKRHDFASSSFLMSIGGVAFFLGQVDKGFTYVCEGARINTMSPVASQQIADMQRQLASRGDSRSCGSRLGIDGAIARAKSIVKTQAP